ncbi:MAG: Isoaspartyl dipeptidase [Chloroflexi bacterium]|nr:Isoaspartyl dipeptidase [Chloroflexota bacterium]
MITLIEEGEIYSPGHEGVKSILLSGSQIHQIGRIDRAKLSEAGVEYELINATDCIVVPGLIDTHSHIAGGGGEQSFRSRQPEITVEELVSSGITTVIGCLGTDTVTRSLSTLLATARKLEEQGVTAFVYSGGFPIPTPTFTGSVLEDLVIIDRVIGVGEIAISDMRSTGPIINELVRVVSEAYIGGTLSGKAGITNFHTGSGKDRLKMLHEILDNHEVMPECLYPSHVNRTLELLHDAIALTRRGCFVDMDTTEEGLGKFLRYYQEHGGAPDKLTVSSDSHTPGANPKKHFKEIVDCIQKHDLSLEEILPYFTLNPSNVLKMPNKGRIAEQADADLLVLNKETLEIVHVIALGKHLVKNGRYAGEPPW